MRGAFIITLYVVSVFYSKSQDLTNSYDIQTLSELSLNQLLSVKNNFELPLYRRNSNGLLEEDEESENLPIESRSGNLNINETIRPVAMALRRESKPSFKGPSSVSRGDWVEDTGKKSIGNIFQMSITTLAFLAFGGYLLCLVVQSLKDKESTNKIIVITSSTAAPVTMAMFRRRRRRRRRPVRIRRPQRPKRNIDESMRVHNGNMDFDGPTVDMAPHVDSEAMLDALVSLSEAYTRYHTVDYKRINQTIINF